MVSAPGAGRHWLDGTGLASVLWQQQATSTPQEHTAVQSLAYCNAVIAASLWPSAAAVREHVAAHEHTPLQPALPQAIADAAAVKQCKGVARR